MARAIPMIAFIGSILIIYVCLCHTHLAYIVKKGVLFHDVRAINECTLELQVTVGRKQFVETTSNCCSS